MPTHDNCSSFPFSIQTRTELSAFSVGRLLGDLILRYRLAEEDAEEIAVTTGEVLGTVATLSEVAVFSSDHIRATTEGLLQGATVPSLVQRATEVVKREGAVTKVVPKRMSRADMQQFIVSEIVKFPEYTTYLTVIGANMAGQAAQAKDATGEKDYWATLEDQLTEILITKQEMEKKQAKAFAKILAQQAQANALAKKTGAAKKKEVKEAEERLFWRIVRFLAEALREWVFEEDDEEEDDGDDPRDTPPPTVYGEEGEASGWWMDHEVIQLKAIRLQEDEDEISIGGAYEYLGETGQLTPKTDVEFTERRRSPALNHRLARVSLKNVSGVYAAMHTFAEEDLFGEEWAKTIGEGIGSLAGSILAEGAAGLASSAAGMAADLATLGLTGDIVEKAIDIAVDQVFGDVIDAAKEIVEDSVGRAVTAAIGPDAFQPIWTFVGILWPDQTAPVWVVRHGPSSRGAHPGSIPEPQTGRGTRLAGPRPGTGGRDIVVASRGTTRALYTYQFRFFVYQAPSGA